MWAAVVGDDDGKLVVAVWAALSAVGGRNAVGGLGIGVRNGVAGLGRRWVRRCWCGVGGRCRRASRRRGRVVTRTAGFAQGTALRWPGGLRLLLFCSGRR